MKSAIYGILLASALAAPTLSLAQSNAPVSRAQVNAELKQLEAAGYRPGSDNTYYPADIIAAQARVNARNGTTGYGGVMSSASSSGLPAAISTSDTRSLFGHR
ncbi:uncharacterized protein DUF4148 [Paraburkholderia sp. BL8N3]|nr:DUF4148 domain-containing protein [Paraburkholderia sp. BL8N3]TCK32748.1 uncharacterized protein DUF4148 [Paraburkholderia sp. BL8N3]